MSLGKESRAQTLQNGISLRGRRGRAAGAAGVGRAAGAAGVAGAAGAGGRAPGRDGLRGEARAWQPAATSAPAACQGGTVGAGPAPAVGPLGGTLGLLQPRWGCSVRPQHPVGPCLLKPGSLGEHRSGLGTAL